MHFRRILCLAGSVGSLVLAPAAIAQSMISTSNATATPAQGARVPVKAAKVRKLDVDIGALMTYDTNVSRSSASLAAANNLKRDDVYFSPNAAVDISLPFGRSVAYLNGSGRYEIYSRNSRLNGENLALAGGLSSDFGRCNTSIDGELNRGRTNIVNLVAQGAGLRNFETTTSTGVTGSCGGVVGLQPFAEFNYGRGANTNIQRKGSDYRTLTYGGGISYVQPSIGELGIIGSIEDTTYTERDGSVGTALSGIQSFPTRSIGVFYTRNVTRFFTGKVRFNYTNVASGVSRSFNGLTGEVSVAVSPTPRYTIKGSIYRRAGPSLTYSVDYTVETGAELSIDMKIMERLAASLNYSYTHERYYSSVQNLIFPLTNDDDNLIKGEVDYTLNRRIILTLGTAYQTRRANSSYYNYDATRLLAGLRGAF